MFVLAMTPVYMAASASLYIAGHDVSRSSRAAAIPSLKTVEITAAESPEDPKMDKADSAETGTQDQESTENPQLANTESFVAKITDSLQRHILFPTIARKPEMPHERIVKLGKGDTVAGILQNAGVSSAEAYYAVKAMSAHYDPRQAKPGQEISLLFAPVSSPDTPLNLQKLELKLDPTKEVVVRKDGEQSFKAEVAEKKVEKQNYARYANIETSLYGSALRAGIPAPVVAELIRIYSWDVDFQRDIRRGDHIEVLYDTLETEDGDLARYGDITYARLHVGGRDLPVYRFETTDGRVDYFQPDGMSIRKALMKTPVDGARLSSGFGMRKHPVLGYNRMHKGVDFAAPVGTPIYAAGDGVIEKIERYGSYGNYIRIRHNSTLKTAYAHMHKFAKNMSRGKRVEQGQVIGYIGATGRVTGPHLHFEVLVDNQQVNPGRVDLPTGERLRGKELEKFKSIMKNAQQRYAALVDGVKYAQNTSEDDKNHTVRQ